jgi:hypothetical protein
MASNSVKSMFLIAILQLLSDLDSSRLRSAPG